MIIRSVAAKVYVTGSAGETSKSIAATNRAAA